MKYPHLSEIASLRKVGLISARLHPTLPLTVYNYTAKAQHLPISEWTPVLSDCRGLILDAAGEIVARPFPKFWNYDQVLNRIPASETFTISEKLDGSLGVVCAYHGNLIVATRGSFESEQAKWAAEWFRTTAFGHYGAWRPTEGLTYLFEIVYPDNRIVVDYHGRKECVLLETLDVHGKSHPHTAIVSPFPKAQLYPSLNPAEIKPEMFPGEEGFVVRWESGFRAKIKMPEYVRLHRLITQVSTRSIWDLLRSGQETPIEDLLKGVPADFQSWVIHQINELKERQEYLISYAMLRAQRYPEFTDRKAFATWVLKQDHPSLIFAALDGKDVSDLAWKICEPKFSTPFRQEAE